MPTVDVASRACTICGRRPVGRVEFSLHDEVTCTVHVARVRCVFCTRPHIDAAPAGWRPFAGSLLRCPTCIVDAVDTQQEARIHLPSVRSEMAAIGVELLERVRVEIVKPAEINAVGGSPTGGVLMGLTDQWTGDRTRVRVAGIRIVAGLPPTYFGRAVTHEIGHAWLAQRGHEWTAPAIEEGLCELFAYAWLKRRGTPLAETLRSQLCTNPDPVYGGGFREVHGAVQRRGIATVLGELLSTGRLS